MSKQLILTEKQRVAKKFVKALEPRAAKGDYCFEGDRYIIAYLSGHLVRLVGPGRYRPEWQEFSLPSLPIDPDAFQFEPIPKLAEHFRGIKTLLQRQDLDSVVIATDCGREGELIARLVLQESGFMTRNKRFFRFWTSGALTPEHIRETMGRLLPGDAKEDLYQSGLARMIADWMVGINATRALSCRFSRPGDTMDMGRVKAVILRLLMDRQAEREAFVAEDFWTIKGKFISPCGAVFQANWVPTGGEGGTGFLPEGPPADGESEGEEDEAVPLRQEGARFKNRFAANKVLNRICRHGLSWQATQESLRIKPKSGPQGPVSGVVVDMLGQARPGESLGSVKSTVAPQPFSLSTLQQEAHRLYGLTLDATEAIAQELSLNLDLITYPRTESTVLNSGMLDHVKLLVQALQQDKVVDFDPGRLILEEESPRVFDDKKVIEDHHAIIPSGQPADLTRLTSDQRKIYQLIVRRFLAAFYPPYTYQALKVEVRVGVDTFQASKTVVVDGGWKEFYHGSIKTVGSRDALEVLQPQMQVGLKYLFLHHGRTTLPSLHNDASLLRAMIHIDRYILPDEATLALPEDDGTRKERISEIESLRRAVRASSGAGTPASRGKILRDVIENGMVYRLGRGKGLDVQDKGRTAFRAIEHLEALDYETSARWELALTNIARGQGENLDGFLGVVRLGMRDLVERVRGIPQALADELTSLGACPVCAAPVVEMAKSYSCRHYPQCSFVLWKNRLEALGKPLIQPEEVKALLQGHPIPLKGLKQKNGRSFDTTGTLTHSPNHGWGLAFGAQAAEATVAEKKPRTESRTEPPIPVPSAAAPPPAAAVPTPAPAMECCRPKGAGERPGFQRPHSHSEASLTAAARLWRGESEADCAVLVEVLRQIRSPLANVQAALASQQVDLARVPLPKGVRSLWDLVRRGEALAVADWVSQQGVRPNFGLYQRIRYVSRMGEGEGVIQDLRAGGGCYVIITKDDSGGEDEAFVEKEVPWEFASCYRCATPGVWIEH